MAGGSKLMSVMPSRKRTLAQAHFLCSEHDPLKSTGNHQAACQAIINSCLGSACLTHLLYFWTRAEPAHLAFLNAFIPIGTVASSLHSECFAVCNPYQTKSQMVPELAVFVQVQVLGCTLFGAFCFSRNECVSYTELKSCSIYFKAL